MRRIIPCRLGIIYSLVLSLIYLLLGFAAEWVRAAQAGPNDGTRPIRVLFLGDRGHHQPRARYEQIRPYLEARGIEMEYTEGASGLTLELLRRYDALLVYANIDRLEDAPAQAILDYVASGGGYVPVHCASYCFRNQPALVELLGAQFLRHGTGTFRTVLAAPDHPILRHFGGFESWDETYVHHMHNEKDRLVLEYRVEGDHREPWTWVRTHGQGRVFYTAWGHDHRTWGHAGFHNLLERGIRWACGRDPSQALPYFEDRPAPRLTIKPLPEDLPPFEYVDVGARIPVYRPGRSWGEQGEPQRLMQKPLSAQASMRHMVVPEGFHVELFAAEPDIQGKPIAMAWDERGRLWLAETVDYPNDLQPRGQGHDRIRICEDTDGDGRADKFTVFAEGLSIPASIAFARGGVIVQAGTETLFLEDLDHDDRADRTTVLFSGWNMSDTHGGVSNFQYGLDNWIWAMQGYNFSRPTVNGRPHQGFRMGFFRFRPDGSALEFLRSTDNNTWGLGISEEGIIFGSTANRNPSVYMPIPNRYYEAVRGWRPSLVLGTIADTYLFKPITDKVRQVDQFGGYTAGAGHALYTARSYPPEFWNQTAFVCEPTGHLVGTFVLSRNGSDFRSTSPFNLVASDDEWTAPIMAEVGPDGHVWVIDWYNFIVQHNPTPRGFRTGRGNAYESELRDKKHGRIYRIVYDQAPPYQPLDLSRASPEQLVATLRHPTMLWRKHAQRLLVERAGTDVVPALLELVSDRSVDAIGLNVGAIHALWTLHGLGVLDGTHSQVNQVVYAALRHPSAGVRRNAVQVLPHTQESVEQLLAADLLRDPDAQVRLAALLALADLPPSEQAASGIARQIGTVWIADRWLQDAATSAAARQGADFLMAVAERHDLDEASLGLVRIVAEHMARGAEHDWLNRLVPRLADADPPLAEAIVRGLAEGWPQQTAAVGHWNEQLDRQVEQLFERLTPGGRGLLLRLAGLWGSRVLEQHVARIYSELLAQVDDSSLEAPRRVAAAVEYAAFAARDPEALQALLERLEPRLPPAVAVGLVRALARTETPKTAELLIERFATMTPELRGAAVGVLLSRPEWTLSLLNAIEQGSIQWTELSLDQRQALANHPQAAIRRKATALLERGGALPSPDRQRVLDEWSVVAERQGDPLAGKEVFKKHCAKCHVHSGEGTRIGPDLTGMAVHPKHELLIHILDPNRSVEGNFRVYTVVTTDGLVVQGLLASESQTTLELFDAEGKKLTVLRDDVEQLVASNKSLMPEGFEKQMSQQEMTDLLAFLTARGKYVPLDLSKVATVPSDRGMFYSREAEVERLIFPDWGPKEFRGVPFHLIDPNDGRRPNVVLFYSPQGAIPPQMPRQIELPCHMPVKAIHMLSGVSGWGFPYGRQREVTLIVRLHYADGQTEDHALRNGEHFADYIRRVDVPGSEFAFALRGQQIRYLAIVPKRTETIEKIELIKGPDASAPVVMAITLETLSKSGQAEAPLQPANP
ncbi:MAG: glycosyl hydrolase [Pirellulaceae bacterium]|nr:MAG: glycosyl hydrolase [Pirellulaceae bacterium]